MELITGEVPLINDEKLIKEYNDLQIDFNYNLWKMTESEVLDKHSRLTSLSEILIAKEEKQEQLSLFT